jgi:DNA-binding CsgD family transcriptional regulator
MVVADPIFTLTPRQLELIAMAASGCNYAEIAEAKYLAKDTVQNTLNRARENIGAVNITHLCVICMDAGVIQRNGSRGSFVPVQDEGVRG